MGKKSATKGKNGELEFIRVVARLTGNQVQLSRNLSQCRDGGDDCLGHDALSIEVKRRKAFISDAQVARWWGVTVRNARARGKQPVLAWRQDFQGWKVVIHPDHPRGQFSEEDVDGCLTMNVALFCRSLIDPGGLGFTLGTATQPPLTYHPPSVPS